MCVQRLERRTLLQLVAMRQELDQGAGASALWQ